MKYLLFRLQLLVEMRVMKPQWSKKIKLQSYDLILTTWTENKLLKNENILVLQNIYRNNNSWLKTKRCSQ